MSSKIKCSDYGMVVHYKEGCPPNQNPKTMIDKHDPELFLASARTLGKEPKKLAIFKIKVCWDCLSRYYSDEFQETCFVTFH